MRYSETRTVSYTLYPSVKDGLSVLGVLAAVFALGFVATVIAGMFIDGRFQMSHVSRMFSSPRSSEQAVADGPSYSDIRGAAERAVESRYAVSAGYQHKTVLDSVSILDSHPVRGANIWAVRMAMTVKTVSIEPQPLEPKHPARLSGAAGSGADPRWVNMAWSGERWFISNYDFN